MKAMPDPQIDPEFESMLGPLSPEEYAQLVSNIEECGQLDKGVVWEEKWILLEGHNRFRACKSLGIPFLFDTMSFNTREEAGDWIWQQQLGRRNLSKDDRDLLIARRVKYLKSLKDNEEVQNQQENKEQLRAQNEPSISDGRKSGDVIAQAAGELKVSEATVKRAMAKADALNKGFCSRCRRVGMVPGCPKCKVLRDRIKSRARAKEWGRKKRSEKAGSPLVNWVEFEKCFGVMVRLTDSIKRNYPGRIDPLEIKGWERVMGELVKKWKGWRKELAK